jgi:hypothetical protein
MYNVAVIVVNSQVTELATDFWLTGFFWRILLFFKRWLQDLPAAANGASLEPALGTVLGGVQCYDFCKIFLP